MNDKPYNPLPMALGIGFTLLWIMMGAFSHQIIYAGVIEFNGWAITMAAAAIAFAALRFFYPPYGSALGNGPFLIAAPLTASIGIALVSIAINLFDASMPLATAGDIASGCGIACALVQVREALRSTRSQREQEQVCVAALIVAVLLYLLLLNVNLELLVIICIFAPAISTALLRYSVASDIQAATVVEDTLADTIRNHRNPLVHGDIRPAKASQHARHRLLLIVLPIVLASITDGTLLASNPESSYAAVGSSAIASSILAAVFITLAIAALMIRTRMDARMGIVLLLLVIAIAGAHLIASAVGPFLLADSLRFLVSFLFLLFLLIEVDGLRINAANFCWLCIAIILGLLVGFALTLAPFDTLPIQIILIVATTILAIYAEKLDRKDVIRVFGSIPQEHYPASDVQAAATAVSREDTDDENGYLHSIESRCQTAAVVWGLSKREEEILNMLVRGRSANSIADEKGISYNTVKSHIAHIYAKTATHTHEELMQVFENLAGV